MTNLSEEIRALAKKCQEEADRLEREFLRTADLRAVETHHGAKKAAIYRFVASQLGVLVSRLEKA